MSIPKTFRKKPVHVKAIEFNGNNIGQVHKFVHGESPQKYFSSAPHFLIHTLEGTMKAEKGDYVIQGVAGEFYPCKPDIFAATYEEIDQDGTRVNSTQYPQSKHTPVMTVAAVIEWLEGEKDGLQSDQEKVERLFGSAMAAHISAGVITIDSLIERLTKGTFEQLDEATK